MPHDRLGHAAEEEAADAAPAVGAERDKIAWLELERVDEPRHRALGKCAEAKLQAGDLPARDELVPLHASELGHPLERGRKHLAGSEVAADHPRRIQVVHDVDRASRRGQRDRAVEGPLGAWGEVAGHQDAVVALATLLARDEDVRLALADDLLGHAAQLKQAQAGPAMRPDDGEASGELARCRAEPFVRVVLDQKLRYVGALAGQPLAQPAELVARLGQRTGRRVAPVPRELVRRARRHRRQLDDVPDMDEDQLAAEVTRDPESLPRGDLGFLREVDADDDLV